MAVIVGFVGSDPRINTTQSGRKVASFSIATTEPGYTTQSGVQVQERTEWHDIVVWGKVAEVVEKYVHKGSQLYVQGKMRRRKYNDRNNVERYAFEVECEVLQLLDRKGDNAGAATPATPQPQAQQYYQPQQPPQGYVPMSGGFTPEDNTPF